MDALRDMLARAGFAMLAVFCGGCAVLSLLIGFAAWGDYRVRRTKHSLLHDPKDR